MCINEDSTKIKTITTEFMNSVILERKLILTDVLKPVRHNPLCFGGRNTRKPSCTFGVYFLCVRVCVREKISGVCVCVCEWRAKSENGKVKVVDGRHTDTRWVIIASLHRRVRAFFPFLMPLGCTPSLLTFSSFEPITAAAASSAESKRLTSELDEWEPGHGFGAARLLLQFRG